MPKMFCHVLYIYIYTNTNTHTHIYICIYTDLQNTNSIIRTYTECPGRNVKHFGRVFLMLKYTDITQNTYIQSWTVTEIMTREKCGLLWRRRTVAASWQRKRARPSVWYRITYRALSNLHIFRLIRQYSSQISCTVSVWRQRWAGMRNV
jgi:hypothetical protein